MGQEVKREIAEGVDYRISDETLPAGMYVLHVTNKGITSKIKLTIAN